MSKYEKIYDLVYDLINNHHKDFIKAIISIEYSITDDETLQQIYDDYLDNDNVNSYLNEFFDNYI